MHLPPQAAGPDRSHFSYNTQTQPPEKTPVPRRTETTKPLLITEKRPRPARRAGTESLLIMNVVTTLSSLSIFWLEDLKYTLVSGPNGPLTRRYAPTSGKPSSGPLRPRTKALSWLKAGIVWQGGDGIGKIYQSVPA